MENAYQTQIESSKAQIEGLKEIHKQEIQEKQLLMESFLESMANIEEDYERTLAELEAERNKKTREYARKFTEDKKGLIKDIETTQNTFNHRAKMCSLAAQGKWSKDIEKQDN